MSRETSIAEAAELLRAEVQVVVAGHEHPDGDALGSLAAFGLAAEQLGVQCTVFLPGRDELPPEYSFLAPFRALLRGTLPADDGTTALYGLDCATAERFDSESVATYAHTVNIDHHIDNSRWGALNVVDPQAGSTAELLFDVLKEAGVRFSPEIATALYVGVVTDTGRFQYSNTSPRTHRVAAELQELGVDVNDVFHRVYESQPWEKVLLRTRTLERLRFLLDGRLSVAVLPLEEFARTGALPAHTEGLIDDLRIAGRPHVVALVREMEQNGRVILRGSLRSTDSLVDVAAIAHRWGGGGHTRAAGFTTTQSVDDVIRALEEDTARQLAAAGQ